MLSYITSPAKVSEQADTSLLGCAYAVIGSISQICCRHFPLQSASPIMVGTASLQVVQQVHRNTGCLFLGIGIEGSAPGKLLRRMQSGDLEYTHIGLAQIA